jgi:hypothetical protein
MLLDSGAGVSVVDLRAAKRLHLKMGKAVEVEGVEGVSQGFWPQLVAANVGGMELPGEYLAMDLGRVSRACGRRVDGLVGADFFSKQVVQIDFGASTIRILDGMHCSPTSETIPLETQVGGMRIPIRVNDEPEQWARLDTGCATALEWVTTSGTAARTSSNQIAVSLAGPPRLTGETRLRLGIVDFGSTPTGFHLHEIFSGEAGLVGNGVLSRCATVTIDARDGRLVLDRQ